MGWKTIKGRRYYYGKSYRSGGRVVADYYGTGPDVALIAEIERLDRMRRDDDREALRFHREDARAIDQALDALVADGRAAASAAIEAAGYHQHRREWRRRRGSGHRTGPTG